MTADSLPRARRRVFLDKEDPALFRTLNGLGLKVRESAEAAGIGAELSELIKVRVSQLNGCAYCLDVHTEEALAAGVSSRRLAVLPAWRDTELFTPQERAALAVAESTTRLPGPEVLDQEHLAAREVLSDAEFSAVNWIAITIGAFNRISIVSGHPVKE
ncbi:carboxymuconolactone decarboxylase family protein [Arthrobacter sp. TMN-37]